MTPEISPTPWTTHQWRGSTNIEDANGRIITDEIPDIVAGRIVRAVNAHEAMKHALEAILAAASPHMAAHPEWAARETAARAALDLAKYGAAQAWIDRQSEHQEAAQFLHFCDECGCEVSGDACADHPDAMVSTTFAQEAAQ